MKKLFCMIIATCMACAMSACGNREVSTDTMKTSENGMVFGKEKKGELT